MPEKKKPSGRHVDRLGLTIPGFAEALGVPEGVARRAVDRGDVLTVRFGGLRRVPPSEVERLRDLFKIPSPA